MNQLPQTWSMRVVVAPANRFPRFANPSWIGRALC